MKKSLKVLMLQCIFLSQVLFGFIQIPIIAAIPLILYEMSKSTNHQAGQTRYAERQYEERMKKESGKLDNFMTQKIIKSELGDTIDQRINDIINQTVTVNGKEYPLFPTFNSKIFVLKNIQDFFHFKYPDLNQFVYEECIKKINDLQKDLKFEVTEEKGYLWGETFTVEKYVDKNPEFKAIDDARDKYMIEYELSPRDLKYMEDVGKENKEKLNTMLKNKIDEVTNGLKQKITTAANNQYSADRLVLYAGQSKEYHASKKFYEEAAKFDENSPVWKAHISILAHLIYWQAQDKQEMFMENEAVEKGNIVLEQQAAREFREKNPQLVNEISAPKDQEQMREQLAKQYVGMKFQQRKSQASQPEQEDRGGVLAKLRTNQPMPVQQPAQTQSLWSRVKSWFGW